MRTNVWTLKAYWWTEAEIYDDFITRNVFSGNFMLNVRNVYHLLGLMEQFPSEKKV